MTEMIGLYNYILHTPGLEWCTHIKIGSISHNHNCIKQHISQLQLYLTIGSISLNWYVWCMQLYLQVIVPGSINHNWLVWCMQIHNWLVWCKQLYQENKSENGHVIELVSLVHVIVPGSRYQYW